MTESRTNTRGGRRPAAGRQFTTGGQPATGSQSATERRSTTGRQSATGRAVLLFVVVACVALAASGCGLAGRDITGGRTEDRGQSGNQEHGLGSQPEHDSGGQPEHDSGGQPKHGTDSQPEHGTDSQPEHGSDSQPKHGPDSQPEHGPGSQPEHGPDRQSELVPASADVPAYKGKAAVPGGLPVSYDAREEGRTSPARDQGDLGTCWAFASLLALESSLLPDEVFDFSEDHMSNNPSFNLRQDEGGEYTMSMAYLLSWMGPVLEEEDPYGDGYSPEGIREVKHVQEIQMLPSRDLEAIKRAVYRCGGVQSSLYTTLVSSESRSEYYNRETRAYCYPSDTAPNHDVVIVGWDDEFPKESFPVEVGGDGAFLCENSWGTQFGEDGFFYVSYYDANIGKNNILYSSVEDTGNYDHIYQSDICGWIGQLGYGRDTAWAVNVYRSEGEERLKAAGFYATGQDTEYEVYVVQDVPVQPDGDAFADRKLAAKGRLDYAGFYTVPLQGDFQLRPGERYGVMIKLTTPGVIHPIAIEYDAGDGKCKVDLKDGEGYISLEGEQWEHVEADQRCNLCLKAYTCDN